ncbi:hypothetical protein [Dolichospermum compactum]|uniref:hypothetical protein n=1 Tax=Dolichospermum compactum TaxID=136073 RepID=UPI0012FD605D|nr:hypothetical protein [Dolichospermum compactum]
MECPEIADVTPTGYGTQFTVKSQWHGPNGRLLRVITIWQQDGCIIINCINYLIIKSDRTII